MLYSRLWIGLGRQITLLEVESRLVRHDLKGPPRVGRERGAKRAMSPYHLSDRALERVDVETSANPGAERHVVDTRRARQLVEEPETLLGEGARRWA